MLYEREVDGDMINDREWAPLHWACEYGHLEIVKLFIDKGAYIEANDEFGMTSLYWACEGGYIEIAGFLSDNGANIETIGSQRTNSSE